MSESSQYGCASTHAREQRPTRHIGVMGGTFNPVHLGHLRAAQEAADRLDLEKIFFVPCAIPPHKENLPIAPAAQRLAWLREAIRNDSRFEVDPLELERTGPSYSVDTLEILSRKFDDRRLVFLLGLDAFRDLDTWKTPERLFAFADFAVMTRPPLTNATLAENLPRCLMGKIDLSSDGKIARHRATQAKIELLEIPALAISATEIRSRLRRGDSVQSLLPESIRETIVQSGLYR